MTLLGATLEFEESAIVALTGATCECKPVRRVCRPTQRSSSPREQSYNVGA
jgi:allophanate hydrolase subunit 2